LFKEENNMEIKAYIKNVKVTPKKLRFLIDGIKKMKPEDALNFLYYTNKKTARIFYKALKSALANTKTIPNIDNDSIKFKLIAIEEGQKLKRYMSGGRGGVKSYFKRFSHIKIVLEGLEKKLKENETKKLVNKVKISKKHGTKSKS